MSTESQRARAECCGAVLRLRLRLLLCRLAAEISRLAAAPRQLHTPPTSRCSGRARDRRARALGIKVPATHLAALGDLLLGHRFGDLERVLLDAGDEAVAVWPVRRALVKRLDDHRLFARHAPVQKQHDLSGLKEFRRLLG